MSWWATSHNTKGLSQGDIVTGVLTGTPQYPSEYLGKSTLPHKGKDYLPMVRELEPYKSDNSGLFIARGKSGSVIVVSHSCEVDKCRENKDTVLVAAVILIDQVSDAAMKEKILSQKRTAFFAIPDVPTLGTCYVDLRKIQNVRLSALPIESRIASMSDEGLDLLHARLIGFFTRLDLRGAS